MNTKAAGKAAIHCACAAGNVDVLKVIMHAVRPQCGSGVCASIILASAVCTTCVCVYGVILCWSVFLIVCVSLHRMKMVTDHCISVLTGEL